MRSDFWDFWRNAGKISGQKRVSVSIFAGFGDFFAKHRFFWSKTPQCFTGNIYNYPFRGFLGEIFNGALEFY